MKIWTALVAASLVLAAATAGAASLSPEMAAMDRPVAPFRLSDEIYYVGASDVTSFLIVTDDGLILTDGGFEDTAHQIEANIKTLGFDIHKVKILMNGHAHFDHAGGLAELKKASGATFVASAADAPVLESGGVKDFVDLGPGTKFPPIKPDRILTDGEKLTLGHTTLTIHLTPGHTRGCTSWTMTAHIGGVPHDVLYICSLSVLSMYSLVKAPSYPGIADDFAHSIATLKSLPCEIMLASHGQFFGLTDKHAKLDAGDKNAFVDPASCKRYLDTAEQRYNAEIAKEKAAP
ncbi:MAG TPA: subclass B3 metallo-beta-lactamase [Rhizomicrobium sp.]|jgi:metallo-beta-lactamase class B